ncbi:MAG: copper amine oxidase N-terminal domain-containing protein [Acidobacteriota bacterium]
MRKSCLLITICCLLLVSPGAQASSTPPHQISIKIGSSVMNADGRPMTMDIAPFILHQRAYVELLPLTKALNIAPNKVFWDADNKAVMLTIEGEDIVLAVGDRDEETTLGTIVMDVPPLDIHGHLVVPVRYVAEALGYSVAWDGKHRAVTIR